MSSGDLGTQEVNAMIPRRRLSPWPGQKGSHLPRGECRYILLHPENHEQRCQCVGFFLDDSTPGTTCGCGHQACYHVGQQEEAACREELNMLKAKIRMLEEEFGREKQDDDVDLSCKLHDLEETVHRHKMEMEMEIKGVYRDFGGLEQNVNSVQSGLQKWANHCEDRIEALVDAKHSVQNDVANFEKRLIDTDDASMKLEERVEAMELACHDLFSHRHRLSPSASRDLQGSSNLSSPAWTLHVSLVPDASQMMPFEKDTIPYKRLLSRGMHRVLAIPGRDAASFNNVISEAFQAFLLGRPWMPLIAEICNAPTFAPTLAGLPMLKTLPRKMVDSRLYCYNWLRENCATLNPDGKICDIYIAMVHDKLSWEEIKSAPRYLLGLEHCWSYDKQLDNKNPKQADRLGACEVSIIENEALAEKSKLPALSSVMATKRQGSSMLSPKSSTEGEYAKRARLNCTTEPVDRLHPPQITEAV